MTQNKDSGHDQPFCFGSGDSFSTDRRRPVEDGRIFVSSGGLGGQELVAGHPRPQDVGEEDHLGAVVPRKKMRHGQGAFFKVVSAVHGMNAEPTGKLWKGRPFGLSWLPGKSERAPVWSSQLPSVDPEMRNGR